MNKLFLYALKISAFASCSILFCPSKEAIQQAIRELSQPEVQGTSEPAEACSVYLAYQQKYDDLISDIECHVASNSDAAQLTEYANIVGEFSQQIAVAVDTITQLCNRMAASEKDFNNISLLLESLLDVEHRLSCLRKNLIEQFTATNIAIATAMAADEAAPQQVIADDCAEQHRQRITSRPSPTAYENDSDVETADYDDTVDVESYVSEGDDFEEGPQAHSALESIQLGALAQQAITQRRPMAENYEFEVQGKTCAPQGMTLNCGYHATCNALVTAKTIDGINTLNSTVQSGSLPQMGAPAPVVFANIQLPTTQEIIQRKLSFLQTTDEVINPASAITGFTLAAFAEFNENLTGGPGTPKIYQSTIQNGVYYDTIEYMQNKEREIITDILELVAFFNSSDENKQRIWNFLEGFVVDNGPEGIQTLFPDQQLSIPGTPFSTENLKNTYLFWRATTTQGSYGSYTNALSAFKQEKTLVIPWLSHSGTHAGCGHWTCKVFIPEKLNGSVVPNFVRIINIDSCDSTGVHAHIDDNVRRFVFDLLHLQIPTTRDLDLIAQMFNPRSIFAERYMIEESAQ